jgi:alpha-galactosidase
MPRIAFIGAGSTVFTRNLINDVLGTRELASSSLALMDIDPERLRTSELVARRLVAAHGSAATVEATLDRRAALNAADYVVTSFQVGGLRPSTVIDFDVPKRYGLRQTIADTLGIGGIMRALRTIPVLLDVCRDIEQLCPDALLLQYVNPMAPLCWAVHEATPVRAVGLCHSVQHTAAQLAAALGVPAVDHHVAGINHMAFFLRLERDGEDLYPALRRVSPPDADRVRYEVLRHLGYFVTESSEHFAEYVPWFIKAHRPDLVERFNIPLDEYVRRSQSQIADWEEQRARLEDRDAPVDTARSDEYGADIIRACETDEPFEFNGNVPNAAAGGRLIDNLPADCCVEVPCVASGRGVEPQPVGTLPRHLAALIRTHVSVQGLIVDAALSGRREPVYHAAMLDPHTGGELPLDEIARLVDELLEAHGDRIPPLR